MSIRIKLNQNNPTHVSGWKLSAARAKKIIESNFGSIRNMGKEIDKSNKPREEKKK
tara:strand:+ start:1442 stop:1609 length:168 start_codon:yes stop_codon:yes gene_type:complete